MNILHISSTDLRGAGSCVLALNTLLNEKGHYSRLVVVFKTTTDATVTGFFSSPSPRLKRWMDAAILRFGKIQSYFTIGKNATDYYFYNLDERKSNFSAKAILKKAGFKPDIIFVHWVSRFVNTAEINELHRLTDAKIFWVMVDNAPITGGCHYPWQCRGYENGCSNCPALLSDSKKHIAQRNFALKKANIPDHLHILTFSSSDKQRAEKCSFYAGRTADVIFHPVNEQVFCPVSSIEAKRYFQLPEDKKIIFFAATDLNERRKGYAELQKALEIFEQQIAECGENSDNCLIVMAGKQLPATQKKYTVPAKYLGYLSEREMVLTFNAATLFVCPTLEDSGPGILGQAMLCGTPTVAFSTGAAVDMIKTGHTGYLARLGDSTDLAAGIEYILRLPPDKYAAVKDGCRTMGMKTCSFQVVGEKIESLLNT
jgi:glycosyltransferase involved in cell wall biosynthesis